MLPRSGEPAGRPAHPTRFALTRAICRRLPPLVSQRVRRALYPYDVARDDDSELIARAQTGSLLSGTMSDFHFYRFSIHGYFDWRNVAIALGLLEKGDSVVEVGANVGTETVCFADIVGPTGKVHAFEPLPSNLAVLGRMIEVAGLGNVVLHPEALSAQSGTLQFVLPPPTASGIGHLSHAPAAAGGTTVDVEVRTLDSYASTLGKTRAFFIDVEGEEVNVLKGGRDYLTEHRPLIVLEASPELLGRAGTSLAELDDTLRSYGYETFRIGRLDVRRADPSLTRKENWLCLARGEAHLADRARASIARCGLLPCVRGLNPLTRA